jgi:response regulator RpfG family c-di-GMP phosphodiesterase
MKKLLVSVVDDDRFFRESMRRLMRSLAYTAEAFASAADFLASPRLAETACVIADVNMPAMTGIELYRHLIERIARAHLRILLSPCPDPLGTLTRRVPARSEPGQRVPLPVRVTLLRRGRQHAGHDRDECDGQPG